MDWLKEVWVTIVGFLTATVGFFHTFTNDVPFIHDFFGEVSLLAGCIICIIGIKLKLTELKINQIILKELQEKHKDDKGY